MTQQIDVVTPSLEGTEQNVPHSHCHYLHLVIFLSCLAYYERGLPSGVHASLEGPSSKSCRREPTDLCSWVPFLGMAAPGQMTATTMISQLRILLGISKNIPK